MAMREREIFQRWDHEHLLVRGQSWVKIALVLAVAPATMSGRQKGKEGYALTDVDRTHYGALASFLNVDAFIPAVFSVA